MRRNSHNPWVELLQPTFESPYMAACALDDLSSRRVSGVYQLSSAMGPSILGQSGPFTEMASRRFLQKTCRWNTLFLRLLLGFDLHLLFCPLRPLSSEACTGDQDHVSSVGQSVQVGRDQQKSAEKPRPTWPWRLSRRGLSTGPRPLATPTAG